MDFVLFALFLVSLIYCCDMPAINGFEIFVNDHDSMLYSIGLSIIASYIFYVFQVAIPQILHFRRARSIGCIKLYEIEELMIMVLSVLQGEIYHPDTPKATNEQNEAIKKHLNDIDIFCEGSRYEIQNHKELTVFEALLYYDSKILSIIDEIFEGQYMGDHCVKKLLDLKKSKLHYVLVWCSRNLPGEYEHGTMEPSKESRKGYNWVNMDVVNNEILSSVEEYYNIYGQIKEMRKKLYKRVI